MHARINIIAGLDSFRGYGLHLIHLVRGLRRVGYFPTVRPIHRDESLSKIPADIAECIVRGRQPEPVEIVLAPPGTAGTPGKRTVFISMWESTQLPKLAVDIFNTGALVIVPSEWCKRVFVESGVNVRVEVVPLGYDEFGVAGLKARVPSSLSVFGTAGRTAHGRKRKGIDEVIRAFLYAFPWQEGVRLEVKCHPDCNIHDPKDPRVVFIRKHWRQSNEVFEWLSGLSAFVSGARAEGFGLWQLQSMAAGVPVIAPAYGGLTQFYGGGISADLAVDHDIVPAEEGWSGDWCEPDIYHMANLMRYVHADRVAAALIGSKSLGSVNGLTWENHAAGVADHLAQLSGSKGEHKWRNAGEFGCVPANITAPDPQPNSVRFFHGLGDCANAAAVISAMRKIHNIDYSVHTSKSMRPVFERLGVKVVESAASKLVWGHPNYQGPLSIPWSDNKPAHNCPVPMNKEIWSAMKEPLAVPVRNDKTWVGHMRDSGDKLVLLHTRGVTSQRWKNMPESLERQMASARMDSVKLIWLDAPQWFNEPGDRRIASVSTQAADELIRLVEHMDAVIGIDSGPLHLARALGIPHVGVWFGMHPTAFVIPSKSAVHICVDGHPFENEYGSRSRYQAATPIRSAEWNLRPVKHISADVIMSALKEVMK